MSLYPQSFIDLLWRRGDPATVMRADGVVLRPAGPRGLKGVCPFCGGCGSERLYVSRRRRFFHCHTCGVAGDGIGYVKRRHGLDFDGAVRWLADFLRLAIPAKA